MTDEEFAARAAEVGFRAAWAEEMELAYARFVIETRCERAENVRIGELVG